MCERRVSRGIQWRRPDPNPFPTGLRMSGAGFEPAPAVGAHPRSGFETRCGYPKPVQTGFQARQGRSLQLGKGNLLLSERGYNLTRVYTQRTAYATIKCCYVSPLHTYAMSTLPEPHPGRRSGWHRCRRNPPSPPPIHSSVRI